MCADVVLTSLYSDRRERMRKNKRRDGIYKKGGRGRQSLAWLVLLLRCCSPFKCNEQSDALQCYVSYVKTEWMETEWKLFLFSMWMKNTFCFIKRWKNVLRLILYSYGKYWAYNLLLRYTLLWNTNTREWQQHGRQNTTCYPDIKLVRNL